MDGLHLLTIILVSKFIVKPSNANFIVYFDKINVIGYRRLNQTLTIQRNWPHDDRKIEHGLNP
jgi:hypothetical protein